MSHPAYEDCHACFEYGQERMGVLVPAMHEKRMRTGETGLSLSTEPSR